MISKFKKYFNQYYQPLVCETLADYLNCHPQIPFYVVLDGYLVKKKIFKRNLASICCIDRRTIYKIYHEKDYHPTKRIAICLGIGMRLDKAEFQTWMHDVGYHLSYHHKLDVVIMYCLERKIYSFTQIDIYLEEVGEKTLIGLK